VLAGPIRSERDPSPLRLTSCVNYILPINCHVTATFPGKLQDCMRKHGLQPGGDETMDWTSRVAANLQTIAIAGTSVTHAYRGDFFIEGAPDWEERP
jgi:hypothetical protein